MDKQTAAAMLRKGGMAVIYDGDEREGEADLVFHASFASPEGIGRLRRDAGGLICLALEKDVAEKLGLPFYTDMLRAGGGAVAGMECTKTAYGDKPAFSIQVNHKGVYTGITDNDRALTIRKIAELAGSGLGAAQMRKKFVEDFYSPGHVFLLIGRGLENRHGHTELTLELARLAGLGGAMVLCEMLGRGKAMGKEDARKYAESNGFAFMEGKQLWRE